MGEARMAAARRQKAALEAKAAAQQQQMFASKWTKVSHVKS